MQPGGNWRVTKSQIQEVLVALYLRLNGYFVSSFIVHAPGRNMTQMDALAVRFPRHSEEERVIQCDPNLAIPSGQIDFLVGEVKGGVGGANFNYGFRQNPSAVRAVLNRFGAFDPEEINRLEYEVPLRLIPNEIRDADTFPSLDVLQGKGRLRFALFTPDRLRTRGGPSPYIYGNDLLAFAWRCFRPEEHRPLCDARYDFEQWGPPFVRMVRFFKDQARREVGIVDDLYSWCARDEA